MNKQQQTRHRLRLAYLRTFYGAADELHADAKLVLADLRRFCRINRGGLVISPKAGMVDPHATMYQAGLRDVYLRIIEFFDFDESRAIQPEELSDAEPQTTTGEP
jgi:hypothetical protein